MKVEYIGFNKLTTKKPQRDNWLTKGNIYIVLAVYAEPNGEVSFRIIGDNNPSPVLFSSREFKINSPKIPSNWIATISKAGIFQLIPEKWSKPGFWENYFNDVPQALKAFEEEKAVLLSEID